MEELIEPWLDHLQHSLGRSLATAAKYGAYVQRLSRWMAAEGYNTRTLDEDALERFAGLHMHREGLSPRSRRALVASLRNFFAWASERGHIRGNPARSLPYPKAGDKLPSAMQLANAERLLMQPDISTFTGVRDAAMLAVLMGCGLRISGLVGLNESQLLWADDHGSERLVLNVTEKGGRQRLIPAPHEARLLVRAYLGHQELEAIDRTLPGGDAVLFIGTRNRRIPEHHYHGEARRLSVRTVREMIVTYGERAGIPRRELRPHALRHLYGTELAEDDVDLITRGSLLGHQDANATQVYTHLAMRKLTKVVDRSNPLGKVHTPVTDLLRQLQQRG